MAALLIDESGITFLFSIIKGFSAKNLGNITGKKLFPNFLFS